MSIIFVSIIIVIVLVPIIGVIYTLITGGIALVGACRKALQRNTTDGFLDNVCRGISGNPWVVFAVMILILPVYLLLTIIVSLRGRSEKRGREGRESIPDE